MPIARRFRLVPFLLLAVASCAPPAPANGPAATIVEAPPPPSTAAAPTAPPPSASEAPPAPPAPPPAHAAAPVLAEPSADEDVVRLSFRDRSVPPPYHRSFTIVATRTFIRKTVTSYGTVLGDAQSPFTSEAFDKAIAALRAHKIANKAKGPERPGCTGGTGRSLEVKVARKLVVQGEVERCGGAVSGTLSGDLDAFSAALDRDAPQPGGPRAAPEDKGY